MQTPAYVQHCRAIIGQIDLLSQGKADRGEVAKSVNKAIEINTNPTLPTYQRMVEAAQKHKLVTKSDQVNS